MEFILNHVLIAKFVSNFFVTHSVMNACESCFLTDVFA